MHAQTNRKDTHFDKTHTPNTRNKAANNVFISNDNQKQPTKMTNESTTRKLNNLMKQIQTGVMGLAQHVLRHGSRSHCTPQCFARSASASTIVVNRRMLWKTPTSFSSEWCHFRLCSDIHLKDTASSCSTWSHSGCTLVSDSRPPQSKTDR